MGRFLFLLFCFLCQSSGLLTVKEVEFVINLVERLSVLQCVIVSDTPVTSILASKLLSEHLLLSSCIDSGRLLSYFPDNHLKTMLVLKMSDTNVKDIFNRESRSNEVIKAIWLILTDSYEDLESLPIPYDCEFYAAIDFVSNITVYEIYTLGNDTIIREVGYWAPADLGLSFSAEDYLVRRINLMGLNLKRMPFVEELAPEEMDLVHAQTEVLDGIQTIMNISFEMIPYEEAEGSGYDVAEVPVVYSAFTSVDDVIAPTIDIVINMYVKKSMRSLENFYIKPFEPLVWACILAWISAASVCFLLIYLIHKRIKTMADLLELTLMPLDAFCLQDGSGAPGVDTVRLVKIVSRAAACVIYSAYSAAIISYMTVRMPFIPFDDLKGLIENGNYKLGGLRDTFQVFYFNVSGDEVVKTVQEKFLLRGDEHPINVTSGVEMMCANDHFVFMGYSAIIPNMATPCQILQIRKPVAKALVGFQISPNSTFGPSFRKLLLRFYSAGIVNRRQKRVDSKATPDDDLVSSEDGMLAVSIQLVAGMFNIAFIGVVLSVIVLGIECTIGNRRGLFIRKNKAGKQKQKRALFLKHIKI